jgi:hypothetical protein
MRLFTSKQISRVANILDNSSQVVLGTLVINPILETDQRRQAVTIISGIIILFLIWWLSLRVERLASHYG